MGWIGVDLDGTLAHYDSWNGVNRVGDPIIRMLDRVKLWLKEGREVRIFTARASMPGHEKPIQEWLTKHGIGGLRITNVKDFDMTELWDDRAVQVIPNTGETIGYRSMTLILELLKYQGRE